jgi:hypothetical protein
LLLQMYSTSSTVQSQTELVTIFFNQGKTLCSHCKTSRALRFFQDVTPCRLVVGYRCFGANYRFHLQGSSVSSSPSSSFLRSGGTCPNGVTRRVQTISNAKRFCPLAATELTYCMYRAADSSSSHCYYQQVACRRYSPNAQHVFHLATRNKDWHYMFCFIRSNRYFPYILRLCTRNKEHRKQTCSCSNSYFTDLLKI